MLFSPLKESHGFNKYVKILRVKMTKKSPEDQQESGRPTRVRKSNKSPEDYQGQEQETWRPEETCKSQDTFKSQGRLPSPKNPDIQESGGLAPSKSQNPEGWLHYIPSNKRRRQRERGRGRHPWISPWLILIFHKEAINLLPRKRKRVWTGGYIRWGPAHGSSVPYQPRFTWTPSGRTFSRAWLSIWAAPAQWIQWYKKINLTGKTISLIKNTDQDLISHLAFKA